jgi:galactokinase
MLLGLWHAYEWGEQPVIPTVTTGGAYELQAAKDYLQRLNKLRQAVNEGNEQKATETVEEIEQSELASPQIELKKKEIIEQRPSAYAFDYAATKTALQAIISGQMYELSQLIAGMEAEALRARAELDDEETILLLM